MGRRLLSGLIVLVAATGQGHPTLRPRVSRTAGPQLLREMHAACKVRQASHTINPYAPPSADFFEKALGKRVAGETPKILQKQNPIPEQSDIVELDKFLKLDWVLECQPESDAIGRWAGQGNEPPGHSYFSYLSRILDLPAESDRRPPLDSVLSSVDQCVQSYGNSGYRSNVDRTDIERTREYLLALGEVARAEKNPQLEDLAAREAERLRVVLVEKRDPIRR